MTLSVQPVGGGSPLTVLAPNTTYELHYSAGYSRANLYVLAVFADSAAQGWSAASAPATGQWASADVFEFNQNTPPASGSGPWMTDVAVGFWFGSTSYAGATEHLCTFTTGSAGNVTVELDLSWIDDVARDGVDANLDGYSVQ